MNERYLVEHYGVNIWLKCLLKSQRNSWISSESFVFIVELTCSKYPFQICQELKVSTRSALILGRTQTEGPFKLPIERNDPHRKLWKTFTKRLFIFSFLVLQRSIYIVVYKWGHRSVDSVGWCGMGNVIKICVPWNLHSFSMGSRTPSQYN